MYNIETDYRVKLNEEQCYFDYATLHLFSNDFIREFKNKLYWGGDNKQWLLISRGKKFYEELFGKE